MFNTNDFKWIYEALTGTIHVPHPMFNNNDLKQIYDAIIAGAGNSGVIVLDDPYINATVSGTVETIVGNIISVAPNTVKQKSFIRSSSKFQANTANTRNYRIWVNTTPDLLGTPIQILAHTTTNTLVNPNIRNFVQRNLTNSMQGLQLGSPGTLNDESASTAALQNYAIDWTVQQYIIRTLQCPTIGTDTATLFYNILLLYNR